MFIIRTRLEVCLFCFLPDFAVLYFFLLTVTIRLSEQSNLYVYALFVKTMIVLSHKQLFICWICPLHYLRAVLTVHIFLRNLPGQCLVDMVLNPKLYRSSWEVPTYKSSKCNVMCDFQNKMRDIFIFRFAH